MRQSEDSVCTDSLRSRILRRGLEHDNSTTSELEFPIRVQSSRFSDWILRDGEHDNRAVRWRSLPYICFSLVYLLRNWTPEQISALSLPYQVTVAIAWILVLHVCMPFFIEKREALKAETEALARLKIPGAKLDDDMCFTDPHLREQSWEAGREMRAGLSHVTGVLHFLFFVMIISEASSPEKVKGSTMHVASLKEASTHTLCKLRVMILCQHWSIPAKTILSFVIRFTN